MSGAIAAAAVAGGAMIYSANKQEDAIKDASRGQASSTNASINWQREALNQQRADLAPFRNLAFADGYGNERPNSPRPNNVLTPSNHFQSQSSGVRPQGIGAGVQSLGGRPLFKFGDVASSLNRGPQAKSNSSKLDPNPSAAGSNPFFQKTNTGPRPANVNSNPYTPPTLSPISELKKLALAQESYNYNPATDPLLNNALSRTIRSVMDAQAAGGKLGSGSTLTSLVESMAPIYMNRQQQMFDQAYNTNNQQFNQLQNIVGMAQNAAAGQGTATANTANNITNLMTNNANAQAAAGIAQANNQANMLNNLMGAGMMAYGMYNRGGAE